MNKLNQLLQELCPDGVEYKKLGEVATISRGGSFQKKDYVESGIPCIHYGQIYVHYNLFVDKTISFISEETAMKQKFAEQNDVVMAVTSENLDDVCKCVAWLGTEKVAVSGHTAIIHHTLNPKYLVYYLRSSMFYAQKAKLAHGTKVIEVKPASLEDIILPVPPIEVQREIVRILDNFTELSAELLAELSAELSARQKQFAYYRDHLFQQIDSECVAIGDICSISRGKVISKDYIQENAGSYPVYSSQTENDGRLGAISSYQYDGEYLTWTTDGANAGTIFYRNGRFSITNVCGLLKPIHDSISIRYLYHVLSITAKRYVSSGMGNPKLMSNVMARIRVPIPSFKEQVHIATILDRFDDLCNDLSVGLPAEIEARKKQYEYYRDKLLTFKPLEP